MTYEEAQNCEPGDAIIFKRGKLKGVGAWIINVYPITGTKKLQIEFETKHSGCYGVTDHHKVSLHRPKWLPPVR